jgi:major membrane immunogen (membrane-anchored lipoprotein)
MKKVVINLVLIGLLFVTGCTPVAEEGKYKEGTYYGYVEDTKDGVVTITSAVVYVNEKGMIKSVFIDSTYNKDNKNTTKKALGDAYGMKATSANLGVIPGGAEWDEQVSKFEEKIVEEQGLEWLVWSNTEETKTDSVSGVTITVSSYYKAVDNALAQAK